MTQVRVVAALVFALAASTAFAQYPAPAPAPAPATAPAPAAAPSAAPAAAAVDNSKCDKPDPHPGKFASPEKMRSWNREVAAWQDCMKKYISDLQGKADVAVKSANGAVADSNAAIAAYNATVKELQAQADAAK
jgi:hypothetical protein